MRVELALLANAAEARDGLLYILGGGWDRTDRPVFPARFIGALALRLAFGQDEIGLHQIEIVVRFSGENAVISQIRIPLDVQASAEAPEDADVPAVLALALSGMPIPKPGLYAFEIGVDGSLVRTLPFVFREDPSLAMGPDETG